MKLLLIEDEKFLANEIVTFITSEGFVIVNLYEEGGRTTVKVIDSGIGISKDFLPYIFEPFRRRNKDIQEVMKETA